MEFNNQQALELIDSMIKTARQEIRDNGFFYLLWGWTIFLASIGHFLLEMFPVPYLPSPLVWPVFTGAAGIWSALAASRIKRREKVRTYVDEFLRALWAGFGISLFIGLIITIWKAPLLIFPICLCFYGLGCFTSGKILRFKPLLWGSVVCWSLALLSLFVKDYNFQILIFAAGVLGSYILPGHLLKKDFDRQQ